MYENTDPIVVRERLELFLNTNDVVVFMEDFGQEIVSMFMKVEDAVETFKDAVENSVEEAEDIIEEVVEEVKDVVSNAVNTVVGWFS